jgi:hypothetical protein
MRGKKQLHSLWDSLFHYSTPIQFSVSSCQFTPLYVTSQLALGSFCFYRIILTDIPFCSAHSLSISTSEGKQKRPTIKDGLYSRDTVGHAATNDAAMKECYNEHFY